ncbi:uncharacterized protein LOC144355062 [Saccoglossus kowalevskii]
MTSSPEVNPVQQPSANRSQGLMTTPSRLSSTHSTSSSSSSSSTAGMGSLKHNCSQSSSNTSSLPVSEGQSLLCSESMLSSTPPSDESLRQTDKAGTPWKHSDEVSQYRQSPVISQPVTSPSNPDRIRDYSQQSENQSNSRNTPVIDDRREEYEAACGNNATSQKMTDNYKTLPINTTSENLNWLADVAVSQSERTLVGMPTGTTSIPSGSIFRPPLPEYNAAQRLYTPGQFSTVYSTSSLGQVPFPPLQYSSRIPPVTLHSTTLPSFAPYIGPPPFGTTPYPPPGFTHAQLTSGHYPQIESYSAMLASMGSHVQAQGHHRPCTFIPAHLASSLHSQYIQSMGSAHSAESTEKNSAISASVYQTVHSLAPGRIVMNPVNIAPHVHSPPPGPMMKSENKDRIDSQDIVECAQQLSVQDKPDGSVYAVMNRSPRHSPVNIAMVRAGLATSRVSDIETASPAKLSSPVPMEERSLRHNRPPNININPMSIQSNKYELINQDHHRLADSQSPLSHTVHGNAKGASSTPGWSCAMPPPQTPPHTPRTPSSANKSTKAVNADSQYQLSPPAYSSQPPHPHFPPHFMKGSIIQLANSELKKVEDLRTEDFVQSAALSEDLKIDSSTVVRIDEEHEAGLALLGFSVGELRIQVTVESTVEHPFFVFGQGWSSVRPDRTLQRYGLSCHQLSVGDVCISLTLKEKNGRLQQKEVKHGNIASDTADSLEQPEFKRPKLEPPALPHENIGLQTDMHTRSLETNIGHYTTYYTITDKQQQQQHNNNKEQSVERSTTPVDQNRNVYEQSAKEDKKLVRLKKRRWSDPGQLVEKEDKESDDHLPVPLPLETLAKFSRQPIPYGISGT